MGAKIAELFRDKKNVIILTVLLLLIAVRFINIDSTTIGHHSWRQADTAAMARNFQEGGYRLFYPQIDWRGDTDGFVETEFPIFSYITALFGNITGSIDLSGRLLSIFLSIIAAIFLSLLISGLINEKTALWSLLIYLALPFNIYFSRAIMPESLLLMSIVIGLFCFNRWLETEKTYHFIISLIFIAIACLIKLPSLYLGLPLLFLAYNKYGYKLFIKFPIWIYVITLFLIIYFWYSHAYRLGQVNNLTFGIWGYGSDKWGNWDLFFSLKFWNRIIFQSIAEKHLTWLGFPIFILGLFIKRKYPKEKLIDFWLIATLVYIIIVAKGNFVHEYYQLPVILPIVVYMGKSVANYLHIENLKSKSGIAMIVLLIGISALSACRYYMLLEFEDKSQSKDYQLAELIKANTNKEDLIIAIDKNDPTIFYLANRKGWRAASYSLSNQFLTDCIEKNAKIITGFYSDFKTESELETLINILFKNYHLLANNEQSFILKLN